MTDGFINFLKPPGMTSSDAVLFVRRLLKPKTAVGHGGTLDPDAAGVLPVCVGRATRLFDYIVDKRKVYVGELCTGAETDTLDASGRVIARSDARLEARDIERVLCDFTGDIWQTPPAYSAIKQGGKRLYALARSGEAAVAPPRIVSVYSIAYLRGRADRHLLRVECGKGVYIRSLMSDIARAAGGLGHMSFLMRERAGDFCAENALTPGELTREGAERALLPMDSLLSAYPRVMVDEAYRNRVMSGSPIPPAWQLSAPPKAGERARVYVGDDFAGMGEADAAGVVSFKAMLLAPRAAVR